MPLDLLAGLAPARRPLEVHRPDGLELGRHPEVPFQPGRDDLLLDRAVQQHRGRPAARGPGPDQRVLVGQAEQRGVQPGGLAGPRGDNGLQAGRRELRRPGPAVRLAEAITDPDAGQAADPRDVARGQHPPGPLPPGVPRPGLPCPGVSRPGVSRPGVLRRDDLQAGNRAGDPADPAARLVPDQRQPLPLPHLTGEQPQVGDLLAARPALDREHGPARARLPAGRGGTRRRSQAPGHERPDPRGQLGRALAGQRRPEEHRVGQRGGGLAGQQRLQVGARRDSVVEQAGQQRVVVLGQDLGRPAAGGRLVQGVRLGAGGRGAEPGHGLDRDRARRQPPPDVGHQVVLAGAAPVDLVDEQQGRQVQPGQRLHQHPGLGLDALHGGQHQDGRVEHHQDPLDLGDEVGVTGRVDQVDLEVADRERGHGRADRDAALAL